MTNFQGSIYHPNLLTFDASLENGLDQNQEKSEAAGAGQFENLRLGRFHVRPSFLREKPYGFSLIADKSQETQHVDFFDRRSVESTRYGGDFGWKNRRVPLRLSLNNDSKIITRPGRPAQHYQDDRIHFFSRNDSRLFGETRFEISKNAFSREEPGSLGQEGNTHEISVFNQRSLPGNDRRLSSSLRSYGLAGSSTSGVFNLNEQLDIRHSDSLDSSAFYDFSDNSSGDWLTKNHRANASVRHRLYESLHSTLNLLYFTGNSAGLSQSGAGVSLDENYVKKLGRMGRLSAGTRLGYSGEKRNHSENLLSVSDEAHTLTTAGVVFLDLPDADPSGVAVTDITGTIRYAPGIDYELSAAGSRLQIRRIPSGSIADGQEVLVDYSAKTNPASSFNTRSENYRLRWDSPNNLVGLFYRVSRENHPETSGAEFITLESLEDRIYGWDFRTRWIGVEWENQDYRSSLSPYERRSLKEFLSWDPTAKSTYLLQSSQTSLELLGSEETQTYYDVTNRYTVLIKQSTRLNLEAGYRWQRGLGIDLDDWTGRCGFEFNLGNLAVTMEYEFEKELYLGEGLINHSFYTKTRRSF